MLIRVHNTRANAFAKNDLRIRIIQTPEYFKAENPIVDTLVTRADLTPRTCLRKFARFARCTRYIPRAFIAQIEWLVLIALLTSAAVGMLQ